MPDETKPTEKKKKTPPAPQKVVDYWPVQKPFVGRGPYPAVVAQVLEKSEELPEGGCDLVVENPNTGRSFNARAALSAKPASGCYTERAAGAAASTAKAVPGGSVTVSTTVRG